MEAAESRFAHLLLPIKELTKNWDVDIASELNDYLEELEDICISLDGGKTRLNFAEAALLIQSSTCIYSKKVELLHSLVYQTLEYFSNHKKRRNKETRTGQENGGDGDHEAGAEEFSAVDLGESRSSRTSFICTVTKVPPLLPESLILLETNEKLKLPLVSVKEEAVCSQKDFRINLFFPREDDRILLQSANSPGFMLNQRPPEPGIHQNQQTGEAENFLAMDDEHMELDVEPEQNMDPDEQIERHQASGRMIREKRFVEAEQQREKEFSVPVGHFIVY